MYSFNLRPLLAMRTAHGWLPSKNVPAAFYSLRVAARNSEPVTLVLVNGVRLTDLSLRTLNAFLVYGNLRFNPYAMPWFEFAELINLRTLAPADSSPFQDEMTWTDVPAWLREIRAVESRQ